MQVLIQYTLQFFYPPFKRVLPFEVYAYLAVGGANTLLNIFLFGLFYEVLLPKGAFDLSLFSIESYTISLLIAFLITIPTGYWLSKNFAFTSGKKPTSFHQFLKYFMVVLQGLISDYILFKIGIVWIGLEPTISKIVSTVLVISLNYILQKYYTFK